MTTAAVPVTTGALRATIAPRTLADALAKIAGIARGHSLPVLGNVRIDGADNRLHLTTTDLDQWLTVTVPADVVTPGTVLAPAKRLSDLAKLASATTIALETADTACIVKSGKSRTKLTSHAVDEWPESAPLKAPAAVTLPAQELLGAIGRTAFAASTQESRPILNGVLVELGPTTLRLVATDGHRLAMDTRLVSEHEQVADFIVPPKALDACRRLFADEDNVCLAMDRQQLVVSSATATVRTRLIEGPYPNYNQVIPTESPTSCIVWREPLTALLKRVAIVAHSETHRVKLDVSEAGIAASAETADVGQASDDIAVDGFTGAALTIGFNASYLLEGLARFTTERVRLFFGSSERAAIICPVDPPEGDGDYRQLAMPMRIID